MSNRYFADISSNNPAFSARGYKDAGHILVAIKATEGDTYVNPRYLQWVIEAHRHGIAVVHYHFGRPDLHAEPGDEAWHFLATVLHHTGPNDYLALDLERPAIGGWTRDPSWSHGFDEYVQVHCRFHMILYASQSDLETSDGWLAGDNRRVWVADWSTDRVVAPKGYVVLLRQYTDGVTGPEPHSFAGIGRCDGDIMSRELHERLTRC